MRITTGQIKELLARDEYAPGKRGRVTHAMLQAFLDNPAHFFVGFSTTYDQALGLVPLIECAVGPANLRNINRNITPERFPLTGTGVRSLNLWVEPCLKGETLEQAVERLANTHTLENTGELAGYLQGHPEEMERWTWVFAIGEQSRWADSNGIVHVPCACVLGALRSFGLHDFHFPLSSYYGVLVSSKFGT